MTENKCLGPDIPYTTTLHVIENNDYVIEFNKSLYVKQSLFNTFNRGHSTNDINKNLSNDKKQPMFFSRSNSSYSLYDKNKPHLPFIYRNLKHKFKKISSTKPTQSNTNNHSKIYDVVLKSNIGNEKKNINYSHLVINEDNNNQLSSKNKSSSNRISNESLLLEQINGSRLHFLDKVFPVKFHEYIQRTNWDHVKAKRSITKLKKLSSPHIYKTFCNKILDSITRKISLYNYKNEFISDEDVQFIIDDHLNDYVNKNKNIKSKNETFLGQNNLVKKCNSTINIFNPQNNDENHNKDRNNRSDDEISKSYQNTFKVPYSILGDLEELEERSFKRSQTFQQEKKGIEEPKSLLDDTLKKMIDEPGKNHKSLMSICLANFQSKDIEQIQFANNIKPHIRKNSSSKYFTRNKLVKRNEAFFRNNNKKSSLINSIIGDNNIKNEFNNNSIQKDIYKNNNWRNSKNLSSSLGDNLQRTASQTKILNPQNSFNSKYNQSINNYNETPLKRTSTIKKSTRKTKYEKDNNAEKNQIDSEKERQLTEMKKIQKEKEEKLRKEKEFQEFVQRMREAEKNIQLVQEEEKEPTESNEDNEQFAQTMFYSIYRNKSQQCILSAIKSSQLQKQPPFLFVNKKNYETPKPQKVLIKTPIKKINIEQQEIERKKILAYANVVDIKEAGITPRDDDFLKELLEFKLKEPELLPLPMELIDPPKIMEGFDAKVDALKQLTEKKFMMFIELNAEKIKKEIDELEVQTETEKRINMFLIDMKDSLKFTSLYKRFHNEKVRVVDSKFKSTISPVLNI